MRAPSEKIHERLGFSGNWVYCAAAPRLQEELQDPVSRASDWGTECHAMLEDAINKGVSPLQDFTAKEYTSSEGIAYSVADRQEMAEVAEEVFNYVQARWVDMGVDATEVYPERKMFITHTGRTDLGGTADVIIAKKFEFEVIDLKTGPGTMVHTDVAQLKLCALAFMEEMEDPQPGMVVHLTIAQPRYWGADPIRTKTVTAQSLWDWRDTVMTDLANATDDPNAVGTPSGSGCKFCAARHNGGCHYHDSAIATALVGVDIPINTITQSMVINHQEKTLYNNDELSKILLLAPVIRNFCDDMESHAKEVIMNGEAVPMHKVITTKGRQKWVGDTEELMEIFKKARSLKPDDYLTTKLRTPKQVGLVKTGTGHDKPLPKALIKAIQDHTGRGPDGIKLVLDTDPGTSASPAFKPIPAQEQPEAEYKPIAADTPVSDLPAFLQ